MEKLEYITALISVVISVTAVWYEFKSRKRKKVIYSKDEYLKIIALEKPEIWNELRFKNPEWSPLIKGQSYTQLNLSDYDFGGCHFIKSNFSQCNLTNSSFENALLDECNFIECNFDNSNFIDASIRKSNFINNNLDEAIGFEESIRIVDGSESSRTLQEIFNKKDDEVIDIIDAMSPKEFENLVFELLKERGYNVLRQAKLGSFYLDILLRQRGVLGENILTAIEIKKYSTDHKIGLNTLNQVEFLIDKSNIHLGIIITNGLFSSAVLSRVKEYGKINLIDRYDLLKLLKGEFSFRNNESNNS